MSIGLNRRELRRSEMISGDSVAMGVVGYVSEGMTIRERRVRWCCLAPWNANWGVCRRVAKRSIDARALEGWKSLVVVIIYIGR